MTQIWGCGLPYISNLRDQVQATGWYRFNTGWGSISMIIPYLVPLLEYGMEIGVDPSTSDLLTCCGFRDVHTPPDAVSAKIYFIASVRRVCGDNIITAILRFVSGYKTGMVQQLNKFCSEIPLLV